MIKKLLIVLTLFFIFTFSSIQAATTYTVTLVYDNAKGDVVGETEYIAGEWINFEVTPLPGFEFHYWIWTSDDFVGPPQVNYTTPIEMQMPAYDITINVYFVDDITGYQEYQFIIGTGNLNPVLFPDIFHVSLDPAALFTFGRLSEAIIMIEVLGEGYYEQYLMVGAPLPPFNAYQLGGKARSWRLTNSPTNDPLIELYFDTVQIIPGLFMERGDVIVKLGTTPNLVGADVRIYLPLDDPFQIDYGGNQKPTPIDGIETILTYIGFWNDGGFLILFSILFISIIILLLLLKVSGMAIIIVSVALMSIFTFMNLLPTWAWLIIGSILLLYLFYNFKSGGGSNDE